MKKNSNEFIRVVKFFIFILLFAFIGNTGVNAETIPRGPIADSWFTTVYNQSNGDIHANSRQLNPYYSYVKLAYQGADIQRDIAVYPKGGGPPVANRNLQNGDVAKIKNVGTLNGKKLALAITPDTSLRLEIENKFSIRTSSVIQTTSSGFSFWVEELVEGTTDTYQKITDPNYYFILSYVSNFGAPNVGDYDWNYWSPIRDPYVMIPYEQASNAYFSGVLNTNTADVTISETPSRKFVPYSYAFRQPGGTPSHLEQRIGKPLVIKSLVLLDKKNAPGIKIPYARPFVYQTVNKEYVGNNKLKGHIKVSQHNTPQSFYHQYPNPLRLTIDIPDELDLTKITNSDISVRTSSGRNITSQTAMLIDNGRIILVFQPSLLSTIGDEEIIVETYVPVDLDKPGIFDDLFLDMYIDIDNVTAGNNEHYVDHTSNIYVRVPAPTGEAVTGTAVFEGSRTQDLNAENLVTNLKSDIPNDTVKVLGFKADKVFDEVKQKDTVIVQIQSEKTGMIADIPVDIAVFSKDLDILDNMVIVPDATKATNKSELVYKPSFEQNVRQASSGTTQLDRVKLTATYSDYLNVSLNDFKLYENGNLISSSLYTPSIDKNKKEVIFTFNNASIKQFIGKKIIIKQNSTLVTNDSGIIPYYDKQTQLFTFPIEAYHNFSQIGYVQTVTQSPITQENQTILYQPKIIAEAVPEATVDPGTQVKSAEDYLKSYSAPDFDFVSYDIDFLTKPNFDTPGKKEFKVVIKEDTFGAYEEVDVVVNVKSPTVTMNTSQVYKDKTSQAIYYDLEQGLEVDNPKDYTLTIDDDIQPYIDSMISDASDPFKLNYEGYKVINANNYKVISASTGAILNTTKVPDENFILRFDYEGQLKFKTENLSYGNHPVTGLKQEVYSNPDANQYLNVTNTTLDPDWSVTIAMPGGIKKDGTTEKYIGGLYFENASGKNFIEDDAVLFKNQTDSDKQLLTKTPLNIKLYQNMGNSSGSYTGELIWTLYDTPNP